MKFVTISDVHIREPGDLQETLFLKFLSCEETMNSDVIFLLGDIFDLVVGSHSEFQTRFTRVFNRIIELSKMGKTIYQFEGNHDFHFKDLIEKINRKVCSNGSWYYINEPRVFDFDGKKYLFAHGDELESDDKSYVRYRMFIRSRFINLLANNLIPYRLIESIGLFFANRSRNRNEKDYGSHYDNEEIKIKFRNMLKHSFQKYDVSTVICGHSHCIDQWSFEEGKYLNNGYFPKTKTFISFDGVDTKLVSLQDN
jgi:UDP-2,3-diacylglucosamine hydrolase